MDRIHPFEKETADHIQRHGLCLPGETLLVAVSGGPDSTALFCTLRALRQALEYERLVVAHFHHGLRGSDADADKRFVAEMARRAGCFFVSGRQDVEAYRKTEGQGLSLEMAARECRRRFLFVEMKRLGAHRLAVGHTADDQAEEVLLRLLRGTGPEGMAAMRSKTHEGIVRPLLWASRRDVLAYLKDKGQPYREDATNRQPICRRNRLRLQVLPELERIFEGDVRRVLCRHAQLAARDADFWDCLLGSIWSRCVRKAKEGRVILDRRRLVEEHPAVRGRLLRRALESVGLARGLSMEHVENVHRLVAKAQSGRALVLPKGVRVAVEGDRVVVTAPGEAHFRGEAPVGDTLRMEGPGEYTWGPWRIHVMRVENFPPQGPAREDRIRQGGPWTVHMDAEAVAWPLEVRSFRPGDRFRPLGMGGSKKVHDLFVDAKVPKSDRARVPIVVDREKICWIAGHRLDDRVRVTPETRNVLAIRCERMASRAL
ncbi:tRNA(Ile)-lysidine synthase [Desulfacinum hydrothermale DSM 13146]|uniref:tRNA(Ile)-lysidine synthase n=1 Tax=Desulfacinum hydrothermale DSM 13146 TaxID=1121390 RepID=A0A1W1XEN5_9BACT|nr:tRNA lysidine(34) synthetase TilS [Desulfacinum hydrothermale]SMC22393.1 tRNA(Ile)-lysidine synthase [Desulfacinum hydrothermale DSM 13146]